MMGNMASLILEFRNVVRSNYVWIREQQERMSLPLDSHMVDMVMRGKDISNVYGRGNVNTFRILKMSDVVTTLERLLLPSPSSLHRHQLWENQVKKMY